MANTLLSNIVAPSAIVTLTGTQTLTNKTLTSPTMTTPTLGVASATSIELGHATDTTIARSAAGVVTIEGVEVVTLSRSQTLTNKSLTSPVVTGTLTAGGSAGTNGQLLASTGSGLQWVTRDVSTLDSLTDVTISSATSGQVLTFTGSAWINADNDANITSAVFATNAQSDLGLVTDGTLSATEDLGSIADVASQIYDMGQLRLDGIVSLSNIDQSVKADYIGYSIIFGF
jgi:hypothetical protein